jgi:glycosyltransferase involved in cell wall biosynthesis
MSAMNLSFVSSQNYHDFQISLSGGRRIFLEVAVSLASHGHKAVLHCKYVNGDRPREMYKKVEINRLKDLNQLHFLGNRMQAALDFPFVFPLLRDEWWRRSNILISLDDPRPCLLQGFEKKILNLHSNPLSIPSHTNKLLCKAREIDIAICCSGYVARNAMKISPFLSRKTIVVYNGIDQLPFATARGDRVGSRLGLDSGKLVVLYSGQITEVKGLHVLIDAFKKVRQSFDNACLIVVGSTKVWAGGWRTEENELYEIEMQRQAFGLPIFFVGKVPSNEMPEYYAAADVVVIPSIIPEAFPLTNLEAMSTGRTVVASRVGGIPEGVIEGETGLLVPSRDAQSLADSLTVLLKNPNMRESMGRRGQEIAKKRFTKDRMLSDYARIIENA